MSRRWSLIMMAGVVAVGMASAPAWADLKIGYVNYQRLMQDSPQAKAAQDVLRNEFASKQKELQTEQTTLKQKEDDLQKNGATMSADQRDKAEKDLRDGNRDLQQKVNEYQDDFNARQNEELSKLQKTLVEEVQEYAQAQKFDLMLAEGVIFSSPALDVTPQVLTALQARGAARTGSGTTAPATGAAPKSSAGSGK